MTAADGGTGEAGGQRRLSGLDGLRALAVVGVLLYHAGVSWLPAGFLGVDLFFVISGFLITSLLLGEFGRRGAVSLRGFWYRRARRLLPALGAMLAVTLVAGLLFWPSTVATMRGDLLASLGYVTNWWFVLRHQSYFAGLGRPSPLQHLWSLAIEEQFYLVWPPVLLLLLLRLRRGRLPVVGGLAAAGALGSTAWMATLALRGDVPYQADASRLYYGTDTHAMGLLAGAAAAAVVVAVRRRGGVRVTPRGRLVLDLVGLLALAGLVWWAHATTEFTPWLYRGGYLGFSVLATVLVVVVSRAGSRVGTALDAAPLRWLGSRSYAVYLWHWPVFVVTRPGLDVRWSPAAALLLRLGLTLLLAEASFRLVEDPVRRHGFAGWARRFGGAVRLPGWARAVPVASLGVLVLGLAAATVRTPGSPGAPVNGSISSPVATVNLAPPPPGPAEPFGPRPYHPSLRPAPAPVRRAPGRPTVTVTAVGDSVLIGAAGALQRAVPGIAVDAVIGRQGYAAIAEIDKLHMLHRLGRVVVIETGTNGIVSPDQFEHVLRVLSDRTRVIVVNDHVPQPWEAINNQMFAAAVHRHPNAVLMDWNAAATKHPQWLWNDGVHLRPACAFEFAALVKAALL